MPDKTDMLALGAILIVVFCILHAEAANHYVARALTLF